MAATSLGRLTLDLAVKLSEFTDGMSRAERETKARTEAMTKSVNSFKDSLADALGGTQLGGAVDGLNSKLGALRGNAAVASAALAGLAVGGAVVAVGALSKMAIETAKADAELVVLSNRANTSVRNFQVLGKASEQLGVSQEQLGDILADVQEKLGEFSATEGGGAADFFDALTNNTSLTADEIRGLGRVVQGKDGVEAIQLMKDKMDELGATQQEQRFVFESLASDLGNLMPLFAEGGQLLSEYGAELEAAGIIKTEEAIKQSQMLAAQTQALHTRYDGLKQQLAAQMMPVLNNLIGYFLDGTSKGNQFGGIVQGIGVVAKATGTVILGLALGINTLVKTFMGAYDQFYNISQTGRAFWEADGVLAKLNALSAGITRAQIIHANATGDIMADWRAAANSVKGMWNDTLVQGDSLSQTLFKINDAQSQYNAGLQTSTVQAKEAAKAEKELAKAKEKSAKAGGDKSRMEQVYSAFVKAGMSDNQARIMTAEVGREGSFADKNLFGYHRDPHNGAINAGMISWQGSRGKQLIDRLRSQGLVSGGKIQRSQESLDAMAMFVVEEIMTNPRFKQTKEGFLANPDIGYEQGAAITGRNYIAWRYDDPKYASGHRNRDKYYDQLSSKLGNKGLASTLAKEQREAERAAQEEARRLEQQLKAQNSIVYQYASEREKAEIEHKKKLAEIEEAWGVDTPEAIKYKEEAVARYEEQKHERVLSIIEKYQDEEQVLTRKHREALRKIEETIPKDSLEYQFALDSQEDFYKEEMRRIREQDAQKFIQKQQYIDGIRKLIQQGEYNTSASVNDTIAQSTMSTSDYAMYSLGNQEDSARATANATLNERMTDISEVEDMYTRNKLIEEAKAEHEAQLYAIELEFAQKRKELEKEVTDSKIALYQGATSSILGLMQGFFGESKTMQRLAWASEKGFTLARILISEKKALMDAWASAPFPYNLGAVATTAVETGALSAAAAAINPKGFQAGGYTGNMAVDQAAGVVHGQEFVFDAMSTKTIGVDNLERIRQGKGLGGDINIYNYAPGVDATATRREDGTVDVKIEQSIKQSWANLQNPNSFESNMINSGYQVQRRRR